MDRVDGIVTAAVAAALAALYVDLTLPAKALLAGRTIRDGPRSFWRFRRETIQAYGG